MKGAAWRVGLFAIIGLSLLAAAVLLAGGHWFVPRESALMRFSTSVWGLQVGAPVVFRGVRMGQVTAVELAPAVAGGALEIPVTAEFEREALRSLLGAEGAAAAEAGASGARSPLIPALVARGLVAKLATQSLLTGQLYVDLDLDAARVTAARPAPAPGAAAAAPRGLPVIPTARSPLQTLQAQLESFDFAQVGRDISALTASMRQLAGGPEPARLLTRIGDAAQALQRMAERLEREVVPLSRSAQAALGEGQRAAGAVGQTAVQLGKSADQVAQQVSSAASQLQGKVDTLSDAGTATLTQVQRSAERVAQAAEALRSVAGDDSTLRLNADRALVDISKAARALRELAELLERHPEALLRGRTAAP